MPRFGLSIIGLVVLALVITACGDTPPPSSAAPGSSTDASPTDRRRPAKAPNPPTRHPARDAWRLSRTVAS